MSRVTLEAAHRALRQTHQELIEDRCTARAFCRRVAQLPADHLWAHPRWGLWSLSFVAPEPLAAVLAQGLCPQTRFTRPELLWGLAALAGRFSLGASDPTVDHPETHQVPWAALAWMTTDAPTAGDARWAQLQQAGLTDEQAVALLSPWWERLRPSPALTRWREAQSSAQALDQSLTTASAALLSGRIALRPRL